MESSSITERYLIKERLDIINEKLDILLKSYQPSQAIDLNEKQPVNAHRFLGRAQIISKINKAQKTLKPTVLPVEES